MGRTWAALAVASAVALPAPGAAAATDGELSALTLSGAAVQQYATLGDGVDDRPLAGVGYSEVVLGGYPGCEATGAC